MAVFGFFPTASNQLRAPRHSTYRLPPSSSLAAATLSESTIGLSTGRENRRDGDEPPASTKTTSTATARASRSIGFDGPGEGSGVLRDNLFNPAAPFPEKAGLVEFMKPIVPVTADDPPLFIAQGRLRRCAAALAECSTRSG
jgi:hypothetical protein